MGTPSSHFALINALKHRTIRAPINRMDKSTIVSIYPQIINETKPTIEPGFFSIPAGSYEEPAVLVVGSSSWWKHLEEGQPLLEIPQGSIVVANSIVTDYCNGLLACNMGDLMPGLFYIEGSHSSMDIKTKFTDRLEAALRKQRAWYLALCQMADSLWATSGGNPRAISETMRIAAKDLGFEDKPWLKDFQLVSMTRCEGCGGLKDPRYPICPHCKLIDKSHPKAKDLQFAS